ncbi:MAG: polysaccharide deacetylase family protein [Ignavibacterium sp.]|jgi:peptidoglycan/xylan/chitin deacetylase (PgdA/CDA1 family)|nr:polysaccharide deacetylase family protein [Ignavibacterium sp.]
MKYLYDPPGILKTIFRKYYWNTTNNKVLITFDDGPNPDTTEIILKRLDEENIKALFFCVGENVQKYHSLAKQILAEGHLIGNHTYNHKVLSKISADEKLFQIENTNRIAEKELGYKIKYFRPAHGRFQLSTASLLNEYNLKNVMWSLLTYDYKNDLEVVNFAVKKYLRNNSIIVLHDSIKTKRIIQDSISIVIDEVNNRNFQFGEADECLS